MINKLQNLSKGQMVVYHKGEGAPKPKTEEFILAGTLCENKRVYLVQKLISRTHSPVGREWDIGTFEYLAIGRQ